MYPSSNPPLYEVFTIARKLFALCLSTVDINFREIMIYDHLHSIFLSTEGAVSIIAQFIENEPGVYVSTQANKRHKGTRYRRSQNDLRSDPESLWQTTWGRMLLSEEVKDPNSYVASKFRRRFRLPFSLFLLVVQKCKDAKVFGESKIPYEFKVLVALRILARGNCADDLNEMSHISLLESNRETLVAQKQKNYCGAKKRNLYTRYTSFGVHQ